MSNPYLPEDMNHMFDLSDDEDRAAEQVAEQIDGWVRFLEGARRHPPILSADAVQLGQAVVDGIVEGLRLSEQRQDGSDD